jgi:hypothetical protein
VNATPSNSLRFTALKPAHLIEPEESLSASMRSLPTDRRLHGRAKVNYFACIRSEAFGDDIVSCLDMSPGGLSFKTRRDSLLDTVLRATVLFSRE